MWRDQICTPRGAAAALVVSVVALLAVASACSSSATEKFEGEWPRGVDRSLAGVTGSLELLLASKGSGRTLFQASGRAEGDGLADNALYSLWLFDQNGNVLALDTDRADEECDEDPNTGEEEDCELVVKMRHTTPLAPFDATTLAGLTLTMREGPGSDGSIAQATLSVSDLRGEVVLEFTVTEADL